MDKVSSESSIIASMGISCWNGFYIDNISSTEYQSHRADTSLIDIWNGICRWTSAGNYSIVLNFQIQFVGILIVHEENRKCKQAIHGCFEK